MKMIVLNHLRCSKPRSQFFGHIIKQDYDTPIGIVRETSFPKSNRKPKYKLMNTREAVNIKFDNDLTDN